MFQLKPIPANQHPMAKYMQNQFKFAEVESVERRKESHELIKQSKHLPVNEVLQQISDLYQRAEREYQYIAMDMADANVKRFSFQDLKLLIQYIKIKPWWDTVDVWRQVFGDYLNYHPEDLQRLFDIFYQNDDMWMRRVAITLQLL